MLLQSLGKFVSVGVLNTIIDFIIFNLLTSRLFSFPKIKANLCSTTVAMIFSFFANKNYVFQNTHGNAVVQAIAFFGVTAFGLYVLQNLVINFLTKTWTWPLRLANRIVGALGLSALLRKDFVDKNGAKAAATVLSLTWNYIVYKKVVFSLL